MADVKITADLTEAIELLAKTLGLAAEEIIPYYARLFFINGIVWVVGSLIMVIVPWVVLWPITLSQSLVEGGDEFGAYMLCGFQWVICIALTWGGGYTICDHIENLVAPKALALQKLIDQIT